jgi:hypothetical protein
MRKKITWVCSSCGTPYGEGKDALGSWRGGNDQYAAHKCPGADPHVGHHDVMTDYEWKLYQKNIRLREVLAALTDAADSVVEYRCDDGSQNRLERILGDAVNAALETLRETI